MKTIGQLFLHRLKLRNVLGKGRVRLDTRSHGFVSGNDALESCSAIASLSIANSAANGRVSACCDASTSLDSGTPVGYLGGGLTF